METLVVLTFILAILNLFLTIGVAGSLANLIESMSGKQPAGNKGKWAMIMQNRKKMHLQEGNPPSYADTLAMSPAPELVPTGWDGVTGLAKNWDGLPHPEE
jgi:hypothetical protein